MSMDINRFKIFLLSLAALFAGACASGETVTFSPDTETVLKNPLNGWVVYLGRHWDETFWEKTGFSHRTDLTYRNKAISEMKRIDT